MFNNLLKELKAKNITRRELAEKLGVTERVIYYKLSGTTEFTAAEMFKIKGKIFPNETLEYLFKK